MSTSRLTVNCGASRTLAIIRSAIVLRMLVSGTTRRAVKPFAAISGAGDAVAGAMGAAGATDTSACAAAAATSS